MIVDMVTARKVADAFVEAWNSHDDIALLDLMHDDVTMTSPIIFQLLNKETGVLQGKTAIASLVRLVMTQLPHVCMGLKEVYAGVGGFAMHCSVIFERGAVETFALDANGKITSWTAYYSSLRLP